MSTRWLESPEIQGRQSRLSGWIQPFQENRHPEEFKAQENRASLIPGFVAVRVKRGHRVLVQSGAGG